MENKKIEVINNSSGRVGFELPDLRFKRVWEQKGARIKVDYDILEEALYDPGVAYLFEEGMLYIEDLKVKQALGLEPMEDEGGNPLKAPVKIINLNDSLLKRATGPMPLTEFSKWFSDLSYEQKGMVADYAVAHECTDFDKNEIIMKGTGINVLKAIELNRKAKEK